MRRRAGIALLLSLFLAHGCGDDSPSGPSTTFTGSVTDGTGDGSNGIADLVSATIQVSGGNLTATVSFAPGPSGGSVILRLDTDENPATGFAGVDGGHTDGALIGFDYWLTASAPGGATLVTINRASDFTQIGTATATFPSSTQVRLTVPLSLLGDDDGRMTFKAISTVGEPTTSIISDRMPDTGVAPGAVH